MALRSPRRFFGLDLRRVGAVVRRHVYVQQRGWHRWFDVAVWPVVDTVIWGSIGVFVDQQGGASRSGAAYMLVGILLMHVLYQSNIAVSTGFMEETWSRNLLNFMVTPLRPAEYVAGVMVLGVAKLAFGLGMVALTAFTLYSFNVLEVGWAVVPVIGVLMLVGWCIALYVISFVLRFGNGAEILAWGVLFVVVALSGAFYPVDAIPSALQPLSQALPSTHAFEAARVVLDGRPLPWERLGYALAGLAVLIPLAVAYLRHMLDVFQRRGFITRYS
ncbi:MAG TPA: ABC transporter permease [Acidimicrobiia bacterium]|nr:ABC transporter permease [Acidimicrobiia bacterium]